MYRLLSLALLASLALTLAACDSDPADEAPPPDLLPLAVGNQWVLSYEQVYHDGSLPDRTGLDTLRVVGAEVIDGEEWFEIGTENSSLIRTFTGYYANREDGVWERESLDDEPYLLYKAPAQAGDTYELPNETIQIDVTVTEVESPLTSEAGTFEGNRYELNSLYGWGHTIPEGEWQFERALAPEVGFVYLDGSMMTINDEGNVVRQSTTEWQLIAFETP